MTASTEPRRVPLPVLLVCAAWLGAGVLVAAVVAPAAFAVLPTRTLAGALVGRVLPVLFYAGLVVGALLAWRGRLAARVGGAAAVLGCAVAQFVIAPRIAAVRAAIGGAIDALPIADPRRAEFGRLHALSVLALGIAMLGAGVALVVGAINFRTENRP